MRSTPRRAGLPPLACVAGALLAAAALLLAAACSSKPPGAKPPANPLTLLSDESVNGDARVHRLEFRTPALASATEVQVLLPPGYDGTKDRYAVLYLLHGAGDTDRSWAERGGAEDVVGSRPLIVVMPDAGHTPDAGWYTDWQAGTPAWETYHLDQLVPWVDAHYRTRPGREWRGVAGLSMGGFGALSYAAQRPDLFSVAASFSGAVDTADGGVGEARAFAQLHTTAGTPDEEVWGPFETSEVVWRQHNPADLVSNLAATAVFLRVGTGLLGPGDSPKDSALEMGVHALNDQFQSKAAAAGITDTYEVTPTGTHAWPEWRADLERFLTLAFPASGSPWFGARPTPQQWRYRSPARTFSVYGWTFTSDPARALEFLDLTAVSPTGLTATGSGRLQVVTAPLYRPRQRYLVSDISGSGQTELTVRADGHGRLSFAIDLGAPHSNQQYTPQAAAAGAAAAGYFHTATVRISG